VILLGVGLVVGLTVVIGLIVSRKVAGDSTNYLVAGRGLILPLVALGLMGQAVDTNATLGNTDLSAEFGFWAGASLPIGLGLCLVVTGLFFAKPMNRMGLLTLADFYRLKYGRGVEVAASLLMMFSFCILLAGNLVAGGYLFERFLGTSYPVGVLLIVGLVLTYTIAGGMFSDSYTGVLQMTINVVAAIGLLVFVAVTYGITIPEGMGPFDFGQLLSADQGATINWATLASLAIGDVVAIDFMQRIFSAKSPETAQRACFLGAVGTFVVGVPFALVALSTPGILAETGAAPSGPVLYALLDDAAPVGMAILVLSGIVAASFSTADGAILGTAAVAVRNVGGVRQEETGHGDDRLLLATRIATLPVVVIAVLFALRVPETGILLTLAFDIMLAGLAVPFMLGLFWERANMPAAVAAIAVGIVIRLVLFALTPTIFGAENNLLYINNTLFDATFDGWPTFIAVGGSAVAFTVTALATRHAFPSITIDQTRDDLEVASLPA
jgi:SSS family solute:Na+ symporter